MDEGKVVVWIGGILGCVAIALITTCGIKADRETQAITRMVQAGADPIAAKCSLQDSQSRDPVCMVYGVKIGAPQ